MTIIPDCNDSKKMVFAKTHSQNIKTKGRQNGEIFNFALEFKYD